MLEHEFEHRRWPETAVALHVETTGGRSERQRILWIGLTRIAGGRIEETWETLVNPQTRVPQHVARRLNLDVEALDGAPLAPEALTDARSILADDPIVGHGVMVHVGPLTYELLWHGLPVLHADCLDTQAIASQRFPDLSRPSLDSVARRVGVRRTAGSPHGVSRFVAEIYLALSRDERAAPAASSIGPERALDALAQAYSAPPGAGPELPALPGVYVFRDAADTPLYVGKAASLRARVPQHFTGGTRAVRLDDGLLSRTTRVDHEVAPSELHALLREISLIEELKPPYNTQRAVHRGTPFLVLRDPPFVRAAAAAAPLFGEETFGPYETTRAVRDTMRTLATVFQLRTCLRRLPATRAKLRVPCIRLGLGQCPAPCAELISVEEYEARVRLARHFLREGKESTLERIDAALSATSDAGWVRDHLQSIRSRLMRVRRTHQPLDLTLAELDGGVSGAIQDIGHLTPSQRHVLARWVRRSRSISRT